MTRSHLGAALAALACGATPASAVVLWQGDGNVTAATAACAPGVAERRDIGVGTILRTLYRPADLSNNGADARFSFVHDGQALYAVFLPGGALPNGNYASFGVRHNGVLIANASGAYRAFSVSPATVTASTTFVEVTGRLTNFLDIAGCTISFRAAYAPKP